jgi:CheY-like chemotaxis protein
MALGTDLIPTILVVDGEVLIRAEIAAYLRDCAYRVIEVGDSDEALAVLKQPDLSIDTMLTDAELPGSMDGFGLAQWVRQNRPEVQIVMAATPNRAASAAGKLCEEGPLLTKPYDPQVLGNRIRQLLAARRGS